MLHCPRLLRGQESYTEEPRWISGEYPTETVCSVLMANIEKALYSTTSPLYAMVVDIQPAFNSTRRDLVLGIYECIMNNARSAGCNRTEE